MGLRTCYIENNDDNEKDRDPDRYFEVRSPVLDDDAGCSQVVR